MNQFVSLIAIGTCCAGLAASGCGRSTPAPPTPAPPTTAAGGTAPGAADDHAHDEVPIGTATIGALAVECAQSHGMMAPGKGMHLIVKLPYSDNGATTVRVWIGTEDRLASFVEKGDYAASHDDYDIHVEAPDPLPADAKWWIEVERPDGTTEVGSIAFR